MTTLELRSITNFDFPEMDETTRDISNFPLRSEESLVGKYPTCRSIDDIRAVLDTYSLTCYESVYISLGGKYNEPTVAFSNPAYLARHDFPSNSQYQMFPAFVRTPTVGRCLVIIVDRFKNDDETRTIVDLAVSQFPHLDVVLYDTTLHLKDAKTLTHVVIEWMVARCIRPEKCLIANYIRFRGCTGVETAQLEVGIPRAVQLVLNESNTYAGCLYQWFGYQYYTYHLLYSYRHYDMSRHLHVLWLFHECAESCQIVGRNVADLFSYDLARGSVNHSALLGFMRHTVDITSASAMENDALFSKLLAFSKFSVEGT